MLDCSSFIILLNSMCGCVCLCTVWFLCLVNGSRPPTSAEWISEWTSLPPTGSWHTAKHTLTSENELPATQNQSQRRTLSQTHVNSHQNTKPVFLSVSPCLTHPSPLLCGSAGDSSVARRFTDEVKSTWPEAHSRPALTHTSNRRLCAREKDRKRCILLTVQLVFKTLKRIKWLFWHKSSYCVPHDQIKDELTMSPKSILESKVPSLFNDRLLS